MTETRVLRERRKVVNYNEDAEQPRGQRKMTDLAGDMRRSNRSNQPSDGTDKENRKKRERQESRLLSELDDGGGGDSDGDSDGPSRPPAKRAKSPARNDDDGSDAVEDSDDDANMFVAFARPGKRIAAQQPAAKHKARPSRAAAARASRRISDTAAAKALPDDEEMEEEEDEGEAYVGSTGGRRGGRPKRNAAAATKERLRRSAAPGAKKSAKGSDSMEEDDDGSDSVGEEDDDGAGGGDDAGDVVIVSDSGSESDDEADDEDEEMEDAKVTVAVRKKAPASKTGAAPARDGRPTRRCVERTAARAAANASKGRPRREAVSEEEDDDDYEGPGVVGRKGAAAAAAAARGSRRAPARGKAAASDDDDDDDEEEEDGDEQDGSGGAARASGIIEDSDVQLVADDDDDDAHDSSDGDEHEEEEEEAPVKRGRGGPRKDESKPAPRRAQPARGRADGRTAKAAAGKGNDGETSSSDGEEHDDDDEEEAPVKRGPGRSRNDGAKPTRVTAGTSKADAKGKGKQQGKVAAPKGEKDKGASKGEKDAKVAAGGGGGGGGGCTKRKDEPVEKILSYDSEKDKYLVKLEGVSYRRTAYVSQARLEATKAAALRMFRSREQTVEIDPEWLMIDRVIASRTVSRGRQGPARQLLVKWRGLEYLDSTWEYEEDLDSEEDKVAIARFERINAPAERQKPPAGGLRQPDFQLPTFCNGCSLRDYQQVSVRWMVNNYSQRRNCILGDEMGLGKTAQSISTLQTLRVVGGVSGPFLVVAPLSTLGHWQREIETWTDMNVVLLAGSAGDRAMIAEHEFYLPAATSGSGGGGGRGGSRGREIKFHVLLVSYDTLLKERHLLRSLPWSAAVFDEAHRLKGINSATRAAVEDMDIEWLLLLTGTPIQNNMLELYSILSLLDPDDYPSPEDFTSRFGGAPGGPPPTVEQIRALQAALAPVLLRRMKEDVEELPQKEEVVVWVELTAAQRAYYRALYEGQIGALLGGASAKNLPGMRNLAMELRKLCCHPVLCEGLEEDLKFKLAAQRSLASPGAPPEFPSPEVELLVRGSGKMVLLHKLLHKLRAEGRRVLIFSQFVIMLNVLEDYCTAVGFPVERIDGTIRGRDRQQAIDRFSAEGEGSDGAFVFLLSTRAGGQGITLTAADTCIIYDSDWNPQNDLQAMARCHRIGQKKEVTVYRLISRDTYEMALFNTASRKYGLDEAILGFSGGSDPESDSARIAELLRHGAHGLLADMEAGLKQGEAFASEDINQILAARTEKRQIGSRAGNTFSVATFAADDGPGGGGGGGGGHRGGRRKRGRAAGGVGDQDGDGDGDAPADEDYWRELMPEAVAAHEAKAAEAPVFLGPRKRKQVNYNLNHKQYNPKLDSDSGSDSDYKGEDGGGGEGGNGAAAGGSGGEEGAEGAEGGEEGGKKRKGRPRKQSEGLEAAGGQGGRFRARKASGAWTKNALKSLECGLVALGPDRWDELYEQIQPIKHSAEEVEAAGRAMWKLYGIAAGLADERIRAITEAYVAGISSSMDDDDPLAPAPLLAPAARAEVGVAGGSSSGAAAPAPAAPAPARPNGMDEYEEKLAKAIPETVPESLHSVLSGLAAVQRLMREAPDNLRHGKLMQELVRLMRPGCTTAVNGLRASYLTLPSWHLLGWWSRAEDEALLMAAAQVGYTPFRPGRAVTHALQNPPLSDKVVLKPEAKDGAGAAADAAAADAGDGTADAKPADAKPAGADGGDADMAEAGGQPAEAAPATAAVAAPPQRRAPGPNGPLELSTQEWAQMVGMLGRRLKKLVPSTLELHRRLAAAQSGKQPLPTSNPSRPSGPPLPSRDATTAAAASRPHSGMAPPPPPSRGATAAVAAAGAGASRPHSGTAPAAAAVPAARPVAVVAPPATIAAVVQLAVVAATAAAARRASGGIQPPPLQAVGAAKPAVLQLKPLQLQVSSPTANVGAAQVAAGGVAQGQQRPQQPQPQRPQTQPQPQQPQPQPQQRTADPHRRASGDAIQRQHDRPAAAAAAAGPSGKSSGQKKQSTLPFARMGSAGPSKTTTPAAAAAPAAPATVAEASAGEKKRSPFKTKKMVAATPLAAAAKVAAAAAPSSRVAAVGSAEKPIELVESE
ncbi:hypothetical protein PLESTB_001122300 [Pleodorina starrii]|uniref:Uncharacterized protein n=1 Tax=Pleodorina starrii TaxID=330485 RepID=A0A9W6BS89_9CHLO|nr:hypothetical protein PLESTB_001122300 [Pleodorina starrii]